MGLSAFRTQVTFINVLYTAIRKATSYRLLYLASLCPFLHPS
jgi:hypothetical protein